jgi:hypothetical protein
MDSFPGRRGVQRWIVLAGILIGLVLMIDIARGQESEDKRIIDRFETMVRYNLDNPHVLPSSQIDSLMATIGGKTIGERIAFWADWFQKDGRARYLFGLDPGGYVTEGHLCDDFQTDCILFFYRTTELGRSSTAREAVQFAFGTRFYSAGVEETILPDGRVRYDIPAHLDYSEDIFRSGIWGKDVTPEIGPVEPDSGNAKFPKGTLKYVPKGKIDYTAFQSGDIAFFIIDETTPKGAEARAQGVLIQHLGILKREGGEVFLIHAAKTGLAGIYEGGKIERVPLKTYLARVDLFKGIVVSRVEEF